MREVVALNAPLRRRRANLRALLRAAAPARAESLLAAASALLLVLAFPDFDLWPLAWVALTPLLIAVARRPRWPRAFALGWITGALFFYGSCWWLTHSMIHYGGIPAPLAYALLLPPVLIVAFFPALFALALAHLSARCGARALFAAPFLWAACEWARLGATGQLWNALGYSQAFNPALIQAARWGGVYAVGFLIVAVNASLAFALVERTRRALVPAVFVCAAVAALLLQGAESGVKEAADAPGALVIAVQPNVPVSFDRSPAENEALVARHLALSTVALRAARQQFGEASPRLVVWPESPMNFTYAGSEAFRELVGGFARAERAAVLFNSLEPAPAGGAYNSAVLVSERGALVAQYDKIRLLPFGEYVPLPWWLGGGLLSALVGDFTPGANYTLLPVSDVSAGVFICFESAFPSIARRFAAEGADVLINISNDGYLGRTPVLKQHLANAVFRAVENERPVLRVTNTGVSAFITPRGEVRDATGSFEAATRAWAVERAGGTQTFYTRRGDLFVALCALVSILSFVLCSLSFVRARKFER